MNICAFSKKIKKFKSKIILFINNLFYYKIKLHVELEYSEAHLF